MADLSLDREELQDVVRRKLWGLVAGAGWWRGVGVTGACRSGELTGFWRWTRRAITTDPDAPSRSSGRRSSSQRDMPGYRWRLGMAHVDHTHQLLDKASLIGLVCMILGRLCDAPFVNGRQSRLNFLRYLRP